MTATESELSLVESAPGEQHASPSPGFFGLVGRAVLGSCFGVVLSAAISLVAFEGSYAGASDDATTEHAISTYQPFLEVIGREFAWVAAAQAASLTPIVLGLLLLVRMHPRGASWVSGRGLLPILLGLVSVFALFATVAHRFPGLFLSILASSRLLTIAAQWGGFLGVLVFGGAAAGYVLIARQARGRKTQVACVLALVLGAGATLGASQLPGPARVFRHRAIAALPPASAAHPNVLVLAVDSLRPDMIDAEHTPHIAKLLAESVYFPNALVTQPRTGPSWAAALTGLPPLSNGVETMFPDAKLGQAATFALPAHLASLGYRTAVFSEYAGEFFGRVDFGFQVAAVPSVELKEITGQMMLMRVPTVLAATSLLYTQGSLGRAMLGRRLTNLMRGMANFASPQVLEDDMLALARIDRGGEKKAAPFFWLAFYSQPHFPYTSSSEFYPEYEVDGASYELSFGRDAANETPIATTEDKQQLVGLYRAALAETDAAIGRLLEKLGREGLLEETIIVLMADHGEGLYECATCFGHGDNLKSLLTLRVPMAFRLPASKYPGAKAARNDAYVSQLDLYPTLLSLLGEKRMEQHEGVALLDKKGAQRAVPARDHFAESGEWLWPTPAVPADRLRYPVITEMAKLERGRIVIDGKYNPEIRAAKHRAVIRPPYKLSYEPGAKEVQYHLYQFEQDPLETNDLIATQPELAEDLKRSLKRSMLRHPRILEVAGYFLSRPEPPPPEAY